MKLTDIKTEIQFEMWIIPQLTEKQLIAGYAKLEKLENPEEFIIVQDDLVIPVVLRDKYQKNDLEFYLKRGCARIAHIVQTGKDGSALLRVHFFNGQVVEIGEIDVEIDYRIEDTARRSGLKFNSAEALAKLLNNKAAIEVGQCAEDNYFLINMGAAADGDFEEDSITESKESNGEIQEPIKAFVPNQVRCFTIFGEGFKIPTEKRNIKKGEEIFFATRYISNMGGGSDGALKLANGKINFTTTASRISALAAGEMNRILQENGSYLKEWDKYAALEGELLLSKARSIGRIKILSIESGEKGTKFFVNKVPKELSKEDRLEITSENPKYLENLNLTWTEYCEQIDRDYKYKKTEVGKENSASEGKKIFSKIIDLGTESITLLDIPVDSDIKENYLIYSIYGDQAQIDRKLKARKLIQEGRSANPLLGLIIEEGAQIPDVQRVTKIKALTPFVKEKIFKQPPTERQIKAIDKALNTPDIALIQGPPGTGKTTVITAIIERLNEIHEKTKSVRGEVLVSAFQHDAVENIVTRLSVNSLPAIKFGKRSGSSETSETNEEIINERMTHWCNDIAQKIREKNPQIKELEIQRNFMESFELYAKSPSTKNAVDLLRQILQVPRGIIGPEQVKTTADLLELLEEEEKLNLDSNKEILSMVRALRITEIGFLDDGQDKAADLLIKIEQQLEIKEKQLLRKAVMWKPGNDLSFLDEFKNLKHNLMERFTPHASFKIEKPRADVLEIFAEVKKQFQKYRSNLDEKDSILSNFLHELEDNPNGVREAIADYNFVFAATVQAAEGTDIKRSKTKNREKFIKYDSVIVDEAARTSPLDLLIPMTQAEKRIILVGDHRQLPHIVNEDIARQLDEEADEDRSYSEKDFINKSMFQYLFNRLKSLEQADGICRTVTLDAQYRTHPILGQLVSDMFYKPYGEEFRSPLDAKYFQHNLPDTNNCPLMWIDVADGKDEEVGTSRQRKSEAKVIAEKINYWINSEEGKNLSFGVISFYKAQVDAIYKELEKYKLTQMVDDKWQVSKEYKYIKNKEGRDTSNERLRIGTVDAFQGMEFDVVFLSVVRTYRQGNYQHVKSQQLNKIKKGLFGRLLSENLLCVSMSRQKKLLIAVGESKIVESELAKQAIPALVEFYKLCKEKGVIL